MFAVNIELVEFLRLVYLETRVSLNGRRLIAMVHIKEESRVLALTQLEYITTAAIFSGVMYDLSWGRTNL